MSKELPAKMSAVDFMLSIESDVEEHESEVSRDNLNAKIEEQA